MSTVPDSPRFYGTGRGIPKLKGANFYENPLKNFIHIKNNFFRGKVDQGVNRISCTKIKGSKIYESKV